MNKSVVIIGFGSIGKKHFDAFSKLGVKVSIISKQNLNEYKSFKSISEYFEVEGHPQIVVISNETNLHLQTLDQLENLNYRGKVLVEKPLTDYLFERKYSFSKVFIGYNLRCHRLLMELKKLIEKKKIFSANVYCGQYLPSWRPNTDYTKSYSADRGRGGGVLRDLSHELDYSYWLFGKFNKLSAIGGKFSCLEISSEDIYSIIAKTEKCEVLTININYLDQNARRQIVINCEMETFILDFVDGTLKINNKIYIENTNTLDTYSTQAERILNENDDDLATMKDGLYIVKLITAIEDAAINERFYKA